jgi:hypothetical protein
LDFIEGLSTEGTKAAIRYALANILARQGSDVCDTEFGKSLKRGHYEFRLRHTESELLARVRPLTESGERLVVEGFGHVVVGQETMGQLVGDVSVAAESLRRLVTDDGLDGAVGYADGASGRAVRLYLEVR